MSRSHRHGIPEGIKRRILKMHSEGMTRREICEALQMGARFGYIYSRLEKEGRLTAPTNPTNYSVADPKFFLPRIYRHA